MTLEIKELFDQLPRTALHRLAEELRHQARSNGLTYTNEKNQTEVITLTLRPRVIPIQRMKALAKVIRTLDTAFLKIAPLYFKDPSLPALLPFAPQELDWLSSLREPGYRPGQIVSRWDANTTFGNQAWKEGFSFFEVNGVGVGGLWYGPMSAEVSLKSVVPELRKIDSRFRPVIFHDMRRMLLQSLLSVRKKLKRTRGVIVLAMEKASGSNYIEFQFLARLFQKLGFSTLVAEPTHLYLKRGEIFCRGKLVDVLYRDTTLSELCLLESKGHKMDAFREAFRRGQVVSSLEGEFDHKSVFEIFTNPEYAHAFTAQERNLFKRHILWTRLVRERSTTDMKGKPMDLLPFIRKHQSDLVLKPNRLYGGKGVAFGREDKRSEWERKIETCLKEAGDWVVQQLGALRKRNFWKKDYYVVSGFFATEKGIGIVGRMSERTVVNVARRGGLTPILFV